MIKVGDTLPATTLMEYNEVEGEDALLAPWCGRVQSYRRENDCSVCAPRAFTPTCSSKHVLGYVEQAEPSRLPASMKSGASASTMRFVMGAWARDQQTNGKVRMLADGSADFAKATA